MLAGGLTWRVGEKEEAGNLKVSGLSRLTEAESLGEAGNSAWAFRLALPLSTSVEMLRLSLTMSPLGNGLQLAFTEARLHDISKRTRHSRF